jgi:hypothetical protein
MEAVKVSGGASSQHVELSEGGGRSQRFDQGIQVCARAEIRMPDDLSEGDKGRRVIDGEFRREREMENQARRNIGKDSERGAGAAGKAGPLFLPERA